MSDDRIEALQVRLREAEAERDALREALIRTVSALEAMDVSADEVESLNLLVDGAHDVLKETDPRWDPSREPDT